MKQQLKTAMFAFLMVGLAILLIVFPSESLEASKRGLHIWGEVVFPSLLPFFIIAELFIGFGIVSFLGVLFEPVMRPLFNVPGEGSFAWMMGMASGYPSGAKISARLREQKALSQTEAERLLTFTNASSPLFMFGAIAIGFFHDQALGLLIAICHYLGNFFVGICMRFHGRDQDKPSVDASKKLSIRRAFRAMHQSRLKDPRPFGEILGDAVSTSIQTLIMVGGFIILFSVLTTLLTLINIIPMLGELFKIVLQILGLPMELSFPFISGLFEISLGAKLMADVPVPSIMYQAVLVSFILGFNGFSVQAQVSSIIAKTDIRLTPYLIARVLHGVFSSLFTALLFQSIYIRRKTKEVANELGDYIIKENFSVKSLDFLQSHGFKITILFIAIGIFLLCKRISYSTKKNTV